MQIQVQYLRAIAAFGVFYYHIAANLKQSADVYVPAVYEVGSAGVDLFFVISGYIMAKMVWEKPFISAHFISGRFWRIAPLYWFATLLVFAIALLAPALLGSTKADVSQLLHSLVFVANGSNPQTTSPTLVVGWTINYEMYFYALIVIFAGILGDKSLLRTCLALCLITLAGSLISLENGYWQFYTDPIILEFVFGIIVFHLIRRQSRPPSPNLAIIMLAMSFAIMLLTTVAGIKDHRVLIWGIPAMVMLYSGIFAFRFISTPFRKTGDWSYEIYIIHAFVIAAGIEFILPPVHTLGLAFFWEVVLLVIILTGIVLAVSAIAHKTFAFAIPKLKKWMQRPALKNA